MSKLSWRDELINGVVMPMPPRPSFNHNRVGLNVSCLLERELAGTEHITVSDGSDLYLGERDRFVPDLMVVGGPGQIWEDGVHGAPELVVEILSPGTVRWDRVLKKAVYGRAGVLEYWVIDPAGKSLEVYRLDGKALVLCGDYTLYSDRRLAQMSEKARSAVATHFRCGLLDGLDIPLKDIFYRTF